MAGKNAVTPAVNCNEICMCRQCSAFVGGSNLRDPRQRVSHTTAQIAGASHPQARQCRCLPDTIDAKMIAHAVKRIGNCGIGDGISDPHAGHTECLGKGTHPNHLRMICRNGGQCICIYKIGISFVRQSRQPSGKPATMASMPARSKLPIGWGLTNIPAAHQQRALLPEGFLGLHNRL